MHKGGSVEFILHDAYINGGRIYYKSETIISTEIIKHHRRDNETSLAIRSDYILERIEIV
jgi:hypothetical protein